jgi:hypothetical protein
MNLKLVLCSISAALTLPLAACADTPGKHPGYLHALTDLRDARWNLEHRSKDEAVRHQEDIAVAEIDRAIEEARHAAIEDGKDVYKNPVEDASLDGGGHLRHAKELLTKAHEDISGEEDNPESREIRHRVLQHIDAAIDAVRDAKFDATHHE